MSVTERVMAAGAWTVDLSPETPGQLMEQIALSRAGFGQIEILPAHLDPRSVSDATLLGLARYTGLYRTQEGTHRLSGPGLPILLGDEDGKGDVIEVRRSTPDGWLTQWATALRPISLKAGTVTSPGGAYTGSFFLTTAKKAWETLNDHFGVEWRIRPDLTFDVGSATALYGDVPRLIVLRGAGAGGRDLSPLPATPTRVQPVDGVVVDDAGWDEDLEDYTTKVVYVTGSEGSEVVTTAATPDADVPFGRGSDGAPTIWDRRIDASGGDDGPDPQRMVTMQLGRFDRVRRELRVSGGQLDAAQLPQVGAPVWLYAPPTVMDMANPVQFRGCTVWPVMSRLLGATWPIVRGCGVYLRVWRSPQAPVWHDLTDYVLWEDGPLQLEVGAAPRGSGS